uniref:Uncharacterized protein n=1 Tax=Parascaris univalens TaxID=6257 RepID=A0A915CKH8_PARUN
MKFGIHGCKCHAQNPSVVSDFFICAVLFLVCGCVPRSFRCSQGSVRSYRLHFSFRHQFTCVHHQLMLRANWCRLGVFVGRLSFHSFDHSYKYHHLASFEQSFLIKIKYDVKVASYLRISSAGTVPSIRRRTADARNVRRPISVARVKMSLRLLRACKQPLLAVVCTLAAFLF